MRTSRRVDTHTFIYEYVCLHKYAHIHAYIPRYLYFKRFGFSTRVGKLRIAGTSRTQRCMVRTGGTRCSMLGHVLARMLFEARGMRRLEARTAAKKSKPRRAVWVK